jgi:hypothetical protein
MKPGSKERDQLEQCRSAGRRQYDRAAPALSYDLLMGVLQQRHRGVYPWARAQAPVEDNP